MHISIGTFLSALLFSALLTFILAFCLKSKLTYSYIGLKLLFIFALTVLIRMFLPIEIFPFTVTIPSEKILTTIKNVLAHQLLEFGKYSITVQWLLYPLWIIGSFYYIHQLMKTYRKQAQAAQLPPAKNSEAVRILKQLCRKRGLEKRLYIIQNNYVKTPCVAGFNHGVIFLPNESYTNEELYYILNHELNHYQNHDNYFKLMLELMNAVYWWNPLFYILKKQISTILEFRADAAVIASQPNASTNYMACLFKTYKRQFANSHSSLTMKFCASSQGDLLKRFNYVVESRNRPKECFAAVLLICICFFLCSFSIVFEASYPFPQEEGVYSIEGSESAYILVEPDGKYLYIDGANLGPVVNINDESIKDLPIYYSKEEIP